MTPEGWAQILLLLGSLLLAIRPLGIYMARVYEGAPTRLGRLLGPLERGIYGACGIDPEAEMEWTEYAGALGLFNLLGLLVLYLLQRLQGMLPLNPARLPAVPPLLAFNTAVSFATNTDWQNYGGETTMSNLTQMAGLTVQNFASAATGMAVLVAFARGVGRRTRSTLGNAWADLVRGTLYVLLPLSLVLAIALVSQGVIQTFAPPVQARLLDPAGDPQEGPLAEQVIALAPAASQVAIKQLGTNGGGVFNANSAHPFENPTPLSNFLEILAILLIPAALCHTYGRIVRDRRHGSTLLAAMFLIFLPLLAATVWAEQAGVPFYARLGIDDRAAPDRAGGNMEGKEVRFGIAGSALWAVATTAASNGSVDSLHDAYTPAGGLVPLWLILLGEVVFGGVGSGLYGLLLFVIVTVFVAGLMIGHTPDYLGKKIETFEMKMAALGILIPCVAVLVGTAAACVTNAGLAAIGNPGAHGLSEILYAFGSAANNNGSAFGGLSGNTPFYNIGLAVAMLLGRYGVAVPVLAIAGSLARKKAAPGSAGTLPSAGPLFALMLCGTVLLVGALTFLPALVLGPIAEGLGPALQ
ncbi:MAG TPA: potassium-transporting ATPase subunit KdpA [Candidatus Polarisedimenticolia bacterium]|nr:potassium-transporting ATPase subunit KdpA [Candidatus Polarisedimenticolia bacterium]